MHPWLSACEAMDSSFMGRQVNLKAILQIMRKLDIST